MAEASREIRLLREADVAALLDADPGLRGAVEALERGFRDYHAGALGLPERDERVRVVYPPGHKLRPYPKDMRILPAMVPSVGAAGIRLGCVSEQRGGGVSMTILMDFERLGLLAFIEDHLLHGVRSGGPSGIAVKHLARPDARRIGMIGTGRISRVQLTVAAGARPIESVKAFSRRKENREEFARTYRRKLDLDIHPVDSMKEAIRDVDIVLVATDSHNAPVLDGNLLAPGTLLCSVTPGELDEATCLRGRVVTTSRVRITQDYTLWEPMARIVLRGERDLDRDVTELGEILAGERPARQSPDEIITFLSPGIGFCDVVVAKWVYDLSVQRGIGEVAWTI
ncbi:MAG TPA: Gfo/Idh/MocA family oxidoreductase [Chloroflexota bacterium]|nr:Gfo/Idh/MocA family oxidoreductase [Chloroflexota bacterium]